MRHPILFGGLLTVPPMLMPTLLVRIWSPYYVCVAGVGVALLLGWALRRSGPGILAVVLGTALILGTWSRGLTLWTEPSSTEAMCVTSARAAAQVQANFKRLHPTLPRGTQILVSVTSTGIRGIESMVLRGQAPRAWYWDNSLITLRPEQRRCATSAEYLFRVRSTLDVVEIDPIAFRFYHTGDEPPSPSEVNRPIRAYARGLAACGRTDESVRILTHLSQVESGLERTYDERLVGMVLLGAGREAAADSALAQIPAFPRDVALEIVKKIYSEPTRSGVLDSCSVPAFGLSAGDPEAIRYLMRRFHEEKYGRQALQFANRLLGLVPGDVESRRILAEEMASQQVGEDAPGE